MRLYEFMPFNESKIYKVDNGSTLGSRIILENPSKIQLRNMLEQTKYKKLRGYIDPNSHNLYIWDAERGIHWDIVNLLNSTYGFQIDYDNNFRGYFVDETSDDTVHVNWRNKLGTAWKNIEVDFLTDILAMLYTESYYQKLFQIDEIGKAWVLE